MSLSLNACLKALPAVMLWLQLSGCATTVTLASSPPGADVYIGKRKVGKTPLTLSGRRLGAKTAGGYAVRLEKNGYQDVRLWFPEGARGIVMTLNMQPFVIKDEVVDPPLNKARLDQLAARFLGVQTSLLTGGSEALGAASQLETEMPQFAASHFMAAVALLRRGDTGAARQRVGAAMERAPSEPAYVALYRQLGGDPLETLKVKEAEDDE